MKKVLLSLSMLAAIMTASAQTFIPVGIGAKDDFVIQGNSIDNPTGEYSGPFTYNSTDYTSGVFWWDDTKLANVDNFTATRANGVYTVVTTKNNAYSPIGFGFGDTEGDGTGIPFAIDITNAKTISFQAKASTGAPTLYIQVSDANGINGEIMATGAGDDTKFGSAGLTSTMQTFTYNLTGMMGQTLPDDQGGSMWVCASYPTDCPDRTKASAVDFTKITKVAFFIAGGNVYNGTVTIDNVSIGTSTNLGLGTSSAAANIASTKVFPNPTTGAFTAEIVLKNNANVTVILSDMMGKQLSTKTVANGSASFETAGLANGMYTVTYVVDGTPAKTELVVVK